MSAEIPSEGLPDEIISSSADKNPDSAPDNFPDPRFPRTKSIISKYWAQRNQVDAEAPTPVFEQLELGLRVTEVELPIGFRPPQRRISPATMGVRIPGRMRR